MDIEQLKATLCSGAMYNDFAAECNSARARATQLVKSYEAEADEHNRAKILAELFEKVGEHVSFSTGFKCEYGFNIQVGNNFFANFDCIILDCAEVIIGDNVLFGPRVGLYCANHAIDAKERQMGGCYAKPIKIGNNVWIGAGVNITPGVTIGDNTIIGTGSVVTKDIPANVIAAGVPCKVIREITEADQTGYRSESTYLSAC